VSAARKPGQTIENLAIGTIIEVDGSRIVAELDPKITELSRIYSGETYAIGQFGSIVRIHFGRRVIYALVGRLRMKAEYELEHGISSLATADERIIEADLFGEGAWRQTPGETPTFHFERGVTSYPLPQQTLYLTPKAELRAIYGRSSGAQLLIGEHVGSGGAPCYADMNELLGKHTAVLGSTGSGKSAAVAGILHSIVERGANAAHANWKPRMIVLDPHDEYSAALPASVKLSTDNGSLSLPYWLLDFQEVISLLIGKTEFAATSQTNIIKTALIVSRREGAKVLGLDEDRVSVDSPVPFKLATLRSEIDAQKPPQASKHEPFDSILQKLETLCRDGRLDFMMKEWVPVGTADPFPGVVQRLLGEGKGPRIVDLSGVPNEVAGVASAAIARTLFNLKVWQTHEEREGDPVLLVCEEAHRYVPNRGEALYAGAQESIRRIAKEGRKYGIGLMLVSQRPSEVESTVLSQCNSWLALRLTNEADRNYVSSILPDSLAGLTKTLSGLRRREAIFVGQAAVLPSRILIRELAADQLPRSSDVDFDEGWQHDVLDEAALTEVANRWRYQTR